MNQLFEQLPETLVTIRVNTNASVAPVLETLSIIFEDQPVSVTEAPADQTEDIVVVRDGHVVATASNGELLRSLLLVNSDVYITGSRSLDETTLPSVLKALDEIPFHLRGYPDSDSEKLLLITVSRAIERRAYESGDGTIWVGFQRLSRLVNEPGTYRVYEKLCNTNLDVHVYGVADTPPPAGFDLTAHTDTSRAHNWWFVLFRPPTDSKGAAGLFAVERDPNHWEGFWTFRPSRVNELERVIKRTRAT